MQFFACSGMRFNWGAIFHLARFDTVQSGVSPSKAHRSDFLEKQKRRLLMTSHDSPRILRLGKNKFQRGYLLFSLRFFLPQPGVLPRNAPIFKATELLGFRGPISLPQKHRGVPWETPGFGAKRKKLPAACSVSARMKKKTS